MCNLELIGTTDQRHILQGLQRFYRFLDGLHIELILDDTLEGREVSLRLAA